MHQWRLVALIIGGTTATLNRSLMAPYLGPTRALGLVVGESMSTKSEFIFVTDVRPVPGMVFGEHVLIEEICSSYMPLTSTTIYIWRTLSPFDPELYVYIRRRST